MARKRDDGILREPLGRPRAERGPKTELHFEGQAAELKKALAEGMLGAELDVHLAGVAEVVVGNHRNGSSSKTVDTGIERAALDMPRDCHGRFDPALIGKHPRWFPSFDDKIVMLFARGMSTRDLQAHVAELHGIEISPELVSAVTDAMLE